MKKTFSYLVTTYFSAHLAVERGLSTNTIASYSDCMRLLIRYTCDRFGIQPEGLGTELIDADVVIAFLDHVENQRGNRAASRNQRLAAIQSFFHFAARNTPELMHLNERIQAIRAKKTDHVSPPSLSVEEIGAIIDAPDATDLLGARDKALLQTMYNSGARVQELADLSISDLRLITPMTVTLTGKGRKTRTVPLWEDTVTLVSQYLQMRSRVGIESRHLFLNAVGKPITRFGIARMLTKHVAAAAAAYPSLSGRQISPHLIRHTTALHLIESGNDITVVKEWLGHADLKTTSQYVEVSLKRKQQALEKLPPPIGGITGQTPTWKTPELMDFLNRLSRPSHYVAQNQRDNGITATFSSPRNITSRST